MTGRGGPYSQGPPLAPSASSSAPPHVDTGLTQEIRDLTVTPSSKKMPPFSNETAQKEEKKPVLANEREAREIQEVS